MLKKFSMAVFCALQLLLAAACQSSVDWDGIYTFSEKLGEDPGGAAMLVEYRLELDGERCRLQITGYQSDTRIRCSLRAAGNGAEIRFRSYGNGEVENVYGVQVYQVGERLFTLHRASTGSKALVTEWGGLVPDSIGEQSGNYFTRQ
ncbi:DUF5991 domain-containing protein [Microbulbifer halophilus]|uniref:DUF5991 domain-containing protein n=1 Tax=Microbulbifer halophilus TaxID=453963 RepID=A0ABW5EA96_9GAMM|nr:DUF5991 domain-containing protein [Microbulbifer halophilus]MCW8124991.1 DUF5991 domain-containing protein [Microbulbifer halophilus]